MPHPLGQFGHQKRLADSRRESSPADIVAAKKASARAKNLCEKGPRPWLVVISFIEGASIAG
jgi:hypothetical protein